jgi:hypothetical protein
VIDLVVYIAALSAIGIGIACKDPAVALVTVGAIVLGTVLISRLPRNSKE